MPSFNQAEKNRSDRAAWSEIGKKRADEVRRWLVEFRRAQGWRPGMVWDPYSAAYADPQPQPATLRYPQADL